MTVAFICVLITSLLPILWVGIAKYSNGFSLKDNGRPREFLQSVSLFGKRAAWAESNAWESFAPFAAAVIIASIVGVEQSKLDIVAVVFVLMRVLHGLFYITNKPSLRSLVWFTAISCNILLYIFACFV